MTNNSNSEYYLNIINIKNDISNLETKTSSLLNSIEENAVKYKYIETIYNDLKNTKNSEKQFENNIYVNNEFKNYLLEIIENKVKEMFNKGLSNNSLNIDENNIISNNNFSLLKSEIDNINSYFNEYKTIINSNLKECVNSNRLNQIENAFNIEIVNINEKCSSLSEEIKDNYNSLNVILNKNKQEYHDINAILDNHSKEIKKLLSDFSNYNSNYINNSSKRDNLQLEVKELLNEIYSIKSDAIENLKNYNNQQLCNKDITENIFNFKLDIEEKIVDLYNSNDNNTKFITTINNDISTLLENQIKYKKDIEDGNLEINKFKNMLSNYSNDITQITHIYDSKLKSLESCNKNLQNMFDKCQIEINENQIFLKSNFENKCESILDKLNNKIESITSKFDFKHSNDVELINKNTQLINDITNNFNTLNIKNNKSIQYIENEIKEIRLNIDEINKLINYLKLNYENNFKINEHNKEDTIDKSNKITNTIMEEIILNKNKINVIETNLDIINSSIHNMKVLIENINNKHNNSIEDIINEYKVSLKNCKEEIIYSVLKTTDLFNFKLNEFEKRSIKEVETTNIKLNKIEDLLFKLKEKFNLYEIEQNNKLNIDNNLNNLISEDIETLKYSNNNLTKQFEELQLNINIEINNKIENAYSNINKIESELLNKLDKIESSNMKINDEYNNYLNKFVLKEQYEFSIKSLEKELDNNIINIKNNINIKIDNKIHNLNEKIFKINSTYNTLINNNYENTENKLSNYSINNNLENFKEIFYKNIESVKNKNLIQFDKYIESSSIEVTEIKSEITKLNKQLENDNKNILNIKNQFNAFKKSYSNKNIIDTLFINFEKGIVEIKEKTESNFNLINTLISIINSEKEIISENINFKFKFKNEYNKFLIDFKKDILNDFNKNITDINNLSDCLKAKHEEFIKSNKLEYNNIYESFHKLYNNYIDKVSKQDIKLDEIQNQINNRLFGNKNENLNSQHNIECVSQEIMSNIDDRIEQKIVFLLSARTNNTKYTQKSYNSHLNNDANNCLNTNQVTIYNKIFKNNLSKDLIVEYINNSNKNIQNIKLHGEDNSIDNNQLKLINSNINDVIKNLGEDDTISIPAMNTCEHHNLFKKKFKDIKNFKLNNYKESFVSKNCLIYIVKSCNYNIDIQDINVKRCNNIKYELNQYYNSLGYGFNINDEKYLKNFLPKNSNINTVVTSEYLFELEEISQNENYYNLNYDNNNNVSNNNKTYSLQSVNITSLADANNDKRIKSKDFTYSEINASKINDKNNKSNEANMLENFVEIDELCESYVSDGSKRKISDENKSPKENSNSLRESIKNIIYKSKSKYQDVNFIKK